MPRIAHLTRSIRAKTANVLTIDAGDIFQGTPYFKFYHGLVEVELLNKAGYDIYTIGNHEFDEGAKNLAQQLKHAKFDIISANLNATALPELNALIKPSVVKVIDGERVGFIGGITPGLRDVALDTGGVKVIGASKDPRSKEWIQPFRDEIAKLKGQGINKIILVTHIGVEQEKELAEALPDLDAIIGGHSHTRLEKPIVVHHEDGTVCLVVQTGCYGRALGKLDLAFDNDGKVVMKDSRYRLIDITSNIPQDTEVKAYLDEKAKPFIAMRNTIAGVALDDFDNQFRRYPWDSPIGNLISDAIADATAEYGVKIAFQNRGGIRGRIDRGAVSLEKIDEVLPFENQIMVATIKGSTLTKVLENSVSCSIGARFLDVHGLKVAYDPTAEPGKRIVYVLAEDEKGAWKPVDPNADYRIAINNYNFSGGEQYDFSEARDVVKTGKRLATALQEYLTKHHSLPASKPSRIIPVSSNLVSFVKNDKGSSLQIKYDRPGARLTIVEGSSTGVEPLAKVPVPLKDAQVVLHSALDHRGEYVWKVPQSKAKQANGKRWLSVIVQPMSGKGIVISKPVAINQ